jgi:transcriptional regulator with XRE-family HTH domain
MEAVGAYLKEIRERRKQSAVAIADAIGTSQTHIWRIEQGKTQSIGADLLLAFVKAVGGNIDDVSLLLLDKNSTVDDGRKIAGDWLKKDTEPVFTDQSMKSLEEALEVTMVLRHNPARLAQWVEIGKKLMISD